MQMVDLGENLAVLKGLVFFQFPDNGLAYRSSQLWTQKIWRIQKKKKLVNEEKHSHAWFALTCSSNRMKALLLESKSRHSVEQQCLQWKLSLVGPWVFGVLCWWPVSQGQPPCQVLVYPKTPGHLSATHKHGENLCCWGATPLRTICLDVLVRRETPLNGAGIVLQATLSSTPQINPAPAKHYKLWHIQKGPYASPSSCMVWRLSSLKVDYINGWIKM